MVFAFLLRMKIAYPGDYIEMKLSLVTNTTQKYAIVDHFPQQNLQEVKEDPNSQVKWHLTLVSLALEEKCSIGGAFLTADMPF